MRHKMRIDGADILLQSFLFRMPLGMPINPKLRFKIWHFHSAYSTLNVEDANLDGPFLFGHVYHI